MRTTHRLLMLGLAVGLVGCWGEAPVPPAPPAPAPEPPAEQFVAAPVPRKEARPKRAFGPPTYTTANADRELERLDAAFAKVWDRNDPREAVCELVRSTAAIDGSKACDRAREASAKLQKLDLPAQRRVVWERFATAVAAWDIELRDEFLWLAVADGQKALKVDAIWAPEVLPPGAIPRGNPQTLRDFEKQSLDYSVRLWKAVLEYARDRESGLNQALALYADAKAKGTVYLGCLIRDYTYGVTEHLADLDPVLLLALLPKVTTEENTAATCGSRAFRRWQDGQRDGITGMLAKHALDNGVRSEGMAQVMADYDFRAAWEKFTKLPDDSNNPNFPRLRPLSFLIERWAWADPDGALTAVQAEKSEYARRTLITEVGKAWAYKKPDQIERFLTNIDNDFWRDYFRKAAADELERRKQGNAPRDTREKAPRP